MAPGSRRSSGPARAWSSSNAGSRRHSPILEVLRAAEALQRVCEAERWRFCFIGGIALQRWGEPRLTITADLTLLTGFGEEAGFVDTLLSHFEGRVSGVREFALRNRVLLLRSENGVGLDVALAGLPFEESVVRRATSYEYPPGISLRTCSAEDLVVMKTFAARGRDWVDVEGILVRQGDRLDWKYIEQQLRPLADLKGEPELVTRLNDLRRNASQ